MTAPTRRFITSGVATSTPRYCQQLGSIESGARNGLRRQYREETLEQLALISLGKGAGFSLQEIGGMFDNQRQPNLPCPCLLERAEELDQQILRMTSSSKLLRLACPALPLADASAAAPANSRGSTIAMGP